MNTDSHHNVKIGSERSFGLVFAVVFLLIALWPLLSGGNIRLWGVIAAISMVVIAFVFSKLLKPFNLAWFKLGLLMGKIVSPIVLTIVFVLVVIPTGLISRLLQKDPLGLKRKEGDGATYWIVRDADENERSMTNQF